MAATTIGQLLSHSSGLTRDGEAGGQFSDNQPFAQSEDVLADIAGPLALPPNSRFKYSNHGYALLGMVITAITGEPYLSWVRREAGEAVELRLASNRLVPELAYLAEIRNKYAS